MLQLEARVEKLGSGQVVRLRFLFKIQIHYSNIVDKTCLLLCSRESIKNLFSLIRVFGYNCILAG